MVIREAIGSAVPRPTDLVREIELGIVPLIEAQLASGYPPEVVERSLRTMGENLRRFVLAEADDFRAYVIEPVSESTRRRYLGRCRCRPIARISAGRRPGASSPCTTPSRRMPGPPTSSDGFEHDLSKAGLLDRVETPPAMCFLDLTGYTRFTAERGDKAAAELADRLRRLVQRTSVQHGGRPVKWLGDGVMFWFRDPGRGVVAALEMADGVVDGRDAARSRRTSRRTGAVPGWRLLRADGEHGVADRRLRSTRGGARQPGGRRCCRGRRDLILPGRPGRAQRCRRCVGTTHRTPDVTHRSRVPDGRSSLTRDGSLTQAAYGRRRGR